jgi:hypothetical protein
MLEKSFGLLFYLRKQRNVEKGLMYVYLRITVDGQSRDLSVKRSWPASRWDIRANRASGNKEESKELNHYLDVLQTKAYDARKKLIESGKIVTAQAIIDIVSGAEQRKRELMALFKSHNDDMKAMIGKGVAKGTWTNFNTTYKHVAGFLSAQYDVNEINILSLDLEFVKKLYNWFRTVKNLGHNSALKNIANLKKIVINCVDNGWLQIDPFVKFDLSREEVQTSFLVKEEIQAIAYWNSYILNPADRKNKYASPLQATLPELSGLPPAFIQVAENDVLRDEGEAYGRKLDEAGVPVTVVRYNGLIHDYGLLNPLATVPAIRSAMIQAGAEIRNHLKDEK